MTNQWSLVNRLPPLEDHEVHLWQVDLAGAAAQAHRCFSLLTANEQAEANRRSIGQVRDHFTIGRACVRVLIGNALRMDPREVNLSKGVHGKPEILAIEGGALSFNLAHSKNTLLIAIRRQGAIGVDVEYFDRATDIMEVAQANFTESESEILAAADPETRLRTFYRYWTRKEAIGKADGRGLLLPLASFDVSFEPINSRPVSVSESPSGEDKRYFVSDLDLGDGAAGALALESYEAPVRSLIFPLQSSW
jgi:4'-phosphopantetheinyl transferase